MFILEAGLTLFQFSVTNEVTDQLQASQHITIKESYVIDDVDDKGKRLIQEIWNDFGEAPQIKSMDLNQIKYVLILEYTIVINIKETIQTIKSILQPILHFNPTTPTASLLQQKIYDVQG